MGSSADSHCEENSSAALPGEIDQAARVVWDYHHLNHSLQPADLVWVLGSHDLRVAEWASDLFHKCLAPLLLMSGGLGNFTKGVFDRAEADLFAEVAQQRGVPRDKILIENRSTNTGENVAFTRKLLDERGISVRHVIAVQKPYMERRTYATIRRQWPEVAVSVSSPQLSFDDYCTEEFPVARIINIMVGDLQRIMEYPQMGFQIPQDVPETVKEAFAALVAAGYTEHLM